MKIAVRILAAATLPAALLVLSSGCGVLGGPPTGIQLAAATDSTVQVVWNTPAEGSPDNYLLYFRPVNESTFIFLTETGASSYEHKPAGMTGVYKVVARFASDTYEPAFTPTSVPVHSAPVTLVELNADTLTPGFGSGYGWSRDSGIGRSHSMADAGSAADVDFYVSDLDTGHIRLPYVIISPDWADSIDRGAPGLVPRANWRTNGLSKDPLPDEQTPLPRQVNDPPNYFNYASITTTPVSFGFYNAGEPEENRHYALIKVLSVEPLTGRVKVETWYQLIAGLRLIRH
ncbi:fibronectin type III domain-containing protein [candidate division WOR-3 bacterium]|nr:fibronectin type III domain-containing protein [candidate division WOR-3 bacterium]